MTNRRNCQWRLATILFLLVMLGVAESAQSGWFGRCRLFRRHCRPVVCQPTYCQPTCCEPQDQKTALPKAACAPGQFCPYGIVGCFHDENDVCQYCVYDVSECPGNQPGTYTGSCDVTVTQNGSCANCDKCYDTGQVTSIAIPIPDEPDAADSSSTRNGPPTLASKRHFIDARLLKQGLPVGVTLKARGDYRPETLPGDQLPGVVVRWQVPDAPAAKSDKNAPIKNIRLDWFTSTSSDRRHGFGYETKAPPRGNAVVKDATKIADKAYLLRVAIAHETRHYVVFLP